MKRKCDTCISLALLAADDLGEISHHMFELAEAETDKEMEERIEAISFYTKMYGKSLNDIADICKLESGIRERINEVVKRAERAIEEARKAKSPAIAAEIIMKPLVEDLEHLLHFVLPEWIGECCEREQKKLLEAI
ncbi:MAG: hypothetical protein ACP5F8_02420 [Candidatus Aenigmatarchaeota archaeon]